MRLQIVMPVRNAETTIETALKSIYNQTVWNDERFKDVHCDCYVIINGCTDNTEKIVWQFQATHRHNQPNLEFFVVKSSATNIVTALNEGIKECLFDDDLDFVVRMDADDEWYLNKLEQQVLFLKQNPLVDLLGTQMVVNNIKTGQQEITAYPVEHGEIINWLEMARNPLGHPSVMFKRKILHKTGTYDNLFPMAEDFWLWCKMALNGAIIANVPGSPLMKYNLNPNPNYSPEPVKMACWFFNMLKNSNKS